MGIYSIKPRFQTALVPIRDFCLRSGVTPTALNIMGLVVSCGIAICIVQMYTHILFLILIPVFALVRTASNALDGMVARTKGEASVAGELQNEFFDRFSDSLIFSSFIFVVGVQPVLVIVTAVLILLGSFLGVLAKTLIGRRIYDGMMGKADRMLYLGIFAVLAMLIREWYVWNIFLMFVSVGLCQTIVARYWRIVKESKKQP